MKKIPDLSKLIELARLAPAVEWKDDSTTGRKKKLKNQQEESSILDFLDFVGVRAGKFEVRISDLFTVFSSYDDTDMTYRQFRKELKKYMKFVNKDMFCKLNKKLITIEEAYKEASNEEDSEEE